ncbi:MAG: glycoside hydrolase family 2 protein, partial [Calditrichaeota bacterium]|nr:glycoside hydrolase family 2 protein [Calditrichota bacterium]
MIRKQVQFLVIILILSSCQPVAEHQLDINQNWEFRQADKDKWYPSSVPNSVHTDLLNNGLVDDPFYKTNEKKLQWIEKADWEYQTTFTLSEEMRSDDHIEINFAGLDTYADVYLNDSLIIKANNMFRSWQAEITD